MKSIFNFSLILIISLFSCKDNDEKEVIVQPTSQNSSINIDYYMGNQAFSVSDSSSFINAAGNRLKVTTLRYYISNIKLVKDDNSEYSVNDYILCDPFNPFSKKINLGIVPNGTYKTLKFYIGIDPNRNHGGDQTGDLDPAKGMIWTWESGYIFCQLEGMYKKNNAYSGFRIHLGTDANLVKVELPITYTSDGKGGKHHIAMDLLKFFNNPNIIDLNINNNIQSLANETLISSKIRDNVQIMFNYKSFELN